MAKNYILLQQNSLLESLNLNGLSRRIYFWHLFLLGSCFRLGQEFKKNTSQNFGHFKKTQKYRRYSAHPRSFVSIRIPLRNRSRKKINWGTTASRSMICLLFADLNANFLYCRTQVIEYLRTSRVHTQVDNFKI